MSVPGGMVLGVGDAGAIGFPNGKRLVRWLGYRSILDERDPVDPQGRTIRYLLQVPGHYSATHKLILRAFAAAGARYALVPGVTGRGIRSLAESHTRLSRAYQWDQTEGFVAEMDALDAETLLSDPGVGPEFAYADVDDARTTAHAPRMAMLRETWMGEQKRLEANPLLGLTRVTRR